VHVRPPAGEQLAAEAIGSGVLPAATRTALAVDRVDGRTEHGHVRLRPAYLLVLASLLTLALAPPAQAARRHYLRLEVVSVKGQQTVNWNDTRQSGCGNVSRSGSQTISFESLRPGRLSLLRIPRFTRSGKRRRGVTYIGVNFVPTNWTLSRTFQQSPPPSCPPPAEPYAAQASDCGTRGPFAIPVDVGWREGAVTLRAATDRIASPYRRCEYDGFHEFDLIDSKGRLSQRTLTSRRRGSISVRVSARKNEPAAESVGTQTTVLAATVVLRRSR
jgi:hypothetical protein